MIETQVDVRVKLAGFSQLAHRVAALRGKFRPEYFSEGTRVRNKETARVDDIERFSAFVEDHAARVSGFRLIGKRVTYAFFVSETGNRGQATHIGCSASLSGRRWQPAEFVELLMELCKAPGLERAYACRRDEWEYRHLYVKKFPHCSIQRPLGVDMSASLPGLHWWTVFSEELAARHRLDVEELGEFTAERQVWSTDDGKLLHAFRMYRDPDDWRNENFRVTEFLDAHHSFFSLARISTQLEAANSFEEFDAITRPYWARAVPWDRGR